MQPETEGLVDNQLNGIISGEGNVLKRRFYRSGNYGSRRVQLKYGILCTIRHVQMHGDGNNRIGNILNRGHGKRYRTLALRFGNLNLISRTGFRHDITIEVYTAEGSADLIVPEPVVGIQVVDAGRQPGRITVRLPEKVEHEITVFALPCPHHSVPDCWTVKTVPITLIRREIRQLQHPVFSTQLAVNISGIGLMYG